MSHTLIVYEDCPDSISFYLVPDEVITEEISDFLAQAHGRMINVDDENEGMMFLNAARQSMEYKDESDDFAKFWGVFLPYKQEIVQGTPLRAVITRVVSTGFHL